MSSDFWRLGRGCCITALIMIHKYHLRTNYAYTPTMPAPINNTQNDVVSQYFWVIRNGFQAFKKTPGFSNWMHMKLILWNPDCPGLFLPCFYWWLKWQLWSFLVADGASRSLEKEPVASCLVAIKLSRYVGSIPNRIVFSEVLNGMYTLW